jgi:hypothetical protein
MNSSASPPAILLGDMHPDLADSGVLLAVDASLASEWKGDDDARFDKFVEIGSSDEAKKREQPLGEGRCLLLGCSVDTQIFRVATGLGWVDFHPNDELTAKMKKKLGEAMTSAKTKGKPRRLGQVVVTSGCLALVMAHAPGKVSSAAVAAACKTPTKVKSYTGGTLVALEPGTYVAWHERLEHDTDDGFYEGRLRLERQG